MANIIRARSGSTLLPTILLIGIMGASIAYMGSSIINVNKMAKGQATDYDQSLVLNSIVDYTIVGIRQRWCFSDTWIPDSNCNLSHTRNVERLLLSPKAIQTIRSLGIGVDPISLDEITHEFPLSSFSGSHPLKLLLDNLQNSSVSSASRVQISIQRLENNEVYSLSGEIHLQIKATLIAHSGVTGTSSGKVVESSLVLFPQELGGYSLVVADDLKIGFGKSDGTGLGEGVIPTSAKTKSGGLVFDSPVYVNGNINLKSTDGSNYSNVTFSSMVAVGSGNLKHNGNPFIPNQQDGSETYANIKSIGGFKKGLTFLGERDAGLDKMSGKEFSSLPNKDGMNLCVKRNLARWDLWETRESDLFLKNNTTATPNYKFRLGLSRWNRFLPQKWRIADVQAVNGTFYPNSVSVGLVDNKGSNKGKAFVNDKKPFTDDPIMRLRIDISSHEKQGDTNGDGKIDDDDDSKENWFVQTELAMDSHVVIQPEILHTKIFEDNLKDEEKKLENKEKQIADKENEINDIQDKIDDVQEDIDDLQDDIDDLAKEIADLEKAGDTDGANAKKAKQSSKIAQKNSKQSFKASLEANKSTKEGQLANLNKEKTDLEAQVAVAQAQLAEAKDAESNPPEMKISSKPVYAGSSTPEFNQHALNIDFSNEKYFRADIKVQVESYDVGYWGANNYRHSGTKNWHTRLSPHSINGELNFKYDPAIKKVVFDQKAGVANPTTGWAVMDPNKWGQEAAMGITSKDPIDPSIASYGEIESECTDNTSGRSFEFANWDTMSFTDFTRTSWDFAHPSSHSDYPDTLDLDATSSAGTNIDFLVRSIVKNCIVHPDAELVAGFLACDRFEILPRTQPLKIIGTVITSKLVIDPSAMDSGIWWANIYNPQSISELRKARVLRETDGGVCQKSGDPIWHPHPSIKNLANFYSCSPISLRNNANPFTWTTVDPDCGIRSPSSKKVVCKNRHTRFNVKEIGRTIW